MYVRTVNDGSWVTLGRGVGTCSDLSIREVLHGGTELKYASACKSLAVA